MARVAAPVVTGTLIFSSRRGPCGTAPLPDANYSILSLAGIQRTTARLRRRDGGSAGAASWYPLVDFQDSDFVLIDVARTGNSYPLLDTYHETYPQDVRQLAGSFREFLEQALGSGDRLFWLREEAVDG